MTCRDFCYWLQGYFEITGSSPYKNLTEDQADMIKRHLNLVFKHDIDNSVDGGDPVKKQEYQKIHDGISHLVNGDPLVRC